MGKNKHKNKQLDEPGLDPLTDEAATVSSRHDGSGGPQKSSEDDHTSNLPKGYSLDPPKLPEEIEDAAMRSGGYPYDKRLKREEYEEQLQALQIELMKLQKHNLKTGNRIISIYEGRDGSGKSSCIAAFNEHMNPRNTRTVALPKPTETERGQLYFQRYAVHLPSAGEVVLFDRSWYNRAGVERVMGFCTDEQYQEFFKTVPEFERMLIRSGIILVKYWFSITDNEQQFRFTMRIKDPLKQWKLSPMDVEARSRWEAYTKAKETMLEHTHLPDSPWWIVDAVDKKRARLNCISHLLSQMPYQEVARVPVVLPPRVRNPDYHRGPIPPEMYVPSKY